MSGMFFNVYFDIAAIINLVIVLFAYLINQKLPEEKNKVFLYLCIATLCSVTVDLLCALELSGRIVVSNHGLWAMNCLYFVCVCSIPFFFSVYSLALADKYDKLQETVYKLSFFGPVVIQIVSIAITPLTHFVFEITAEGQYVRQTGVFLLYAIMFYQIIAAVYVIMTSKDKNSFMNKIYILSFVLISLVGVLIQFVIPSLLIQHFAISASLLLIYTSLQVTDVITNSVTGLLNLKAFNLHMNVNFKKRNHFTIITIYLEDVQFFLSTFGLEGVSMLLNQVSDYLENISPKYKVFHLDNDLFALIIPESEKAEYHRVSSDIKRQFMDSWKSAVIDVKTTARQCIIRCPQDADTVQDIRDIIESYRSDERYKNNKTVMAVDVDVSARKRYSYIEQLVKNAKSENRLLVLYQPIYSIKEKRIIGAEALVRMTDYEGNILSPDEFVPVAEQDGTILRIGEFVFEDVCRFIATRRLQELGIKMIDVNLSVAQCMQTVITDIFEGIQKYYKVDPSIINLEITETAQAHTPELLYSNMTRFKEIGFNCSLDDYGTGNANLSYMLHMPFNMIKIDKEIVWGAMKDEKAYVMLVGIIDLIHRLNMKVCAEGIETQVMVEVLERLGCDYLQGFYYSKPVSENEFFKMIAKEADVPSDVEEFEELESAE